MNVNKLKNLFDTLNVEQKEAVLNTIQELLELTLAKLAEDYDNNMSRSERIIAIGDGIDLNSLIYEAKSAAKYLRKSQYCDLDSFWKALEKYSKEA